MERYPDATTATPRLASAARPEQTWGAEMEMLLFWRQMERGECFDETARRYPGVVLVPAEHRIEQRRFVAKCAARHLVASNGLGAVFLEDREGFVSLVTHDTERGLGVGLGHEAKHARWLVTWDQSVRLAEDERAALDPGLAALGLEVVTPVFTNRDAAFRELGRVMQSLGALKTAVNVSAGLHVHVGYGRERLEAGPLKFIAAVLFASDVAVRKLDRPARHAYAYSPSTRVSSNVALGVKAHEAEGKKGKMVRHLQRVRAAVRRGPVGIAEATSEILKCETTQGVGELMAAGRRRPVCSFDNYHSPGLLTGPTIEFRQKEGTLDGHVVAAWVKICLRLVEIGYEGGVGRAGGRAHSFIQQCQDYEARAKKRQPLGDDFPWDFLRGLGKLDAAVACLRSGQAMPMLDVPMLDAGPKGSS